MLKLYRPSHWVWRVMLRKPRGWPPTWPNASRKTRLCSLIICPQSMQSLLYKGAAPARPSKRLSRLLRTNSALLLRLNFALYPVYLRGEAYVAEHQGSAAAAEFQKILDHPGVVVNEPIGALAHLGLARAYALSGDTAKAHAAYQDFLTLWKDADPDIPILIAAKAEYAKLK